MTSPATKTAELSKLAKVSGIRHFMDVAFSYQPTGMVMAFTITDPADGSVVWTRSYNSENSRAAAIRRGIALDEIDGTTRKITQFPPRSNIAREWTIFSSPTWDSDPVIGIAFRIVQRYGNRKRNSALRWNTSRGRLIARPLTFNPPTVLRSHEHDAFTCSAWNLIGSEEDCNKVRSNVYVGMGGTYTSGYLGGLFPRRSGVEAGQAFRHHVDRGYRPLSTVSIGSPTMPSAAGAEFGAGISLLF